MDLWPKDLLDSMADDVDDDDDDGVQFSSLSHDDDLESSLFVRFPRF